MGDSGRCDCGCAALSRLDVVRTVMHSPSHGRMRMWLQCARRPDLHAHRHGDDENDKVSRERNGTERNGMEWNGEAVAED